MENTNLNSEIINLPDEMHAEKNQILNNPENGKLKEIYQQVMSDTKENQLVGVRSAIKISSIEHSPQIQQIIDLGLVPKFIDFLRSDNENLVFEAAWALTNIASGNSEQTKTIVDLGAVPILIGLMDSQKDNLKEQAILALGNIAGDSSQLRDMTLNLGILNPLLRVLQDKTKNKLTSLECNAVWCLSNLCRGKPQPNFDLIKPALPVLNKLLNLPNPDQECLTDTCWALSYISDGPKDRIQAVLDNIDLPKLVNLLNKSDETIKSLAIRTIGNIVTGNDVQTQAIVDLDVLKNYDILLYHPKESIRKEVCWSISNITKGTIQQIQAVIDSNIVSKLESLFPTSSDAIKKEITLIYSNALSKGDKKQKSFFLEHSGFKILLYNFVYSEHSYIIHSVEVLEKILPFIDSDKNNPDNDPFDREFAQLLKQSIAENNLIGVLENLADATTDAIIGPKCLQILEKNFKQDVNFDQNHTK